MEVWLHSFLTPALDRRGQLNLTPSGKGSRTHWIEGWVEPRDDLDFILKELFSWREWKSAFTRQCLLQRERSQPKTVLSAFSTSFSHTTTLSERTKEAV